jgi:tetratricopeptide (TPR) repeat protein
MPLMHEQQRKSSDLAPADPSKLNALLVQAVALHQAGQLTDAERLYRRVLNDQPRNFDSLHLLGLVHHQRGEHSEAVRQIDVALTINANVAAAHNSRGVALKALKRLDEAVASYDTAIAIDPGYADAFSNRGLVLAELKRCDEALASYGKAIALRPNFPEAFNNQGLVFAELRRFDEALASYDEAIALRSNYAEAFSNRAAALNELNRLEEAIACCAKAIALKSDFAEAYYNRGNALYALKQLDAASASYDTAVALKPDYAEAFYNRGTTRIDLKRTADALSDFDRAIALRPEYADAYWNRANGRLLVGRYQEGWADYEWRWRAEQKASHIRGLRKPQWDRCIDVKDKTLLLHAEQGFGDTIMVARYVRRVAEAGARIILEVPAALEPLLAEFGDVAQVVISGQPLPPFDLHCPLMSLPGAFGTTLETIPRDVPYLSVPESYTEKWRRRLQEFHRPRIGISWAGRPTFKRDHDRSIGLRGMLPLLSCMGMHFFSIQKYLREGDAEILQHNPHIIQLGASIENFADTAAIMSSLDLVISSDTATVHLAGALAKPVWILLHFVPDWRWLLDRSDSPWYPTARLFRQSERENWTSVVADVGRELQLFQEGFRISGN